MLHVTNRQNNTPNRTNAFSQLRLQGREVRGLREVAGQVDLGLAFRIGGEFHSGNYGHITVLEGGELLHAIHGVVVRDRHNPHFRLATFCQ